MVQIEKSVGDQIEENVGSNAEAIMILDNSDEEPNESIVGTDYRVTPDEGDTLDFGGSLIAVKRHNSEAMYELYCQHARKVGFSVRKYTQRTNKVGEVVEKYFVCSNEGLRKTTTLGTTRKTNFTRTNCKAMLRVKKCSDDLFKVVEHIVEHNHVLSGKERSHMHRSHRKITSEKAVLIEDMIASGIKASDSYRYMVAEAGGEHLVGHTMKDHLNFANRMKKNGMKRNAIEVGDVQRLIDVLCQEGAEDEDFYYRFKLDDDGRLSNVFWRDSMMGEDYHMYGDVVVFDTTYRTNKYSIVYAPFVGLNNHQKNVMFGCALISDENTETFEWLFEVFKKSMKLKCPVTIFTDQDLAITNAIARVFPEARHRLCIWHFYQNAVSRFDKLKGNKNFNDDFQQCLTRCVNKQEFEDCWASMITAHDLKENWWFARLYELREKWCIAYNKDFFCTNFFSSQQGESTTSAIGFKANKTTNLYEFYKIFKTTVQRWRSIEQADDFECSQAIPSSRITLTGMLKHASEVYTISVFHDFEDEFLKSISTTVDVVGEELDVKVYDVQNHDADTPHRVNFLSSESTITCTCRRFEEYGLLCCHGLRILDRNSVKQIPSCYIKRRWTKFAKKDLWDEVSNSCDGVMTNINPWRHKMARKYYSLVIQSQTNEATRRIVEEGYTNMFVGVEALTTPNLIEETSIHVPYPAKASTTKGRRKRIKGHIEKSKKEESLGCNKRNSVK